MKQLKRRLRETFPSAYKHWLAYARERELARIAAILRSPSPPQTLPEEMFDSLQAAYSKWWPSYDFDHLSCWARGHERAIEFLRTIKELQPPGAQILEAGGGDGMTALALQEYGHRVTIVDMEDWRMPSARSLTFLRFNLGAGLPNGLGPFDFAFSFNSFEHITHPDVAFEAILARVKPGGLIYLDFNPLFASPLGLHAFCFHMPYPQFLFDPATIERKLAQLNLNDLGRTMQELQPLNRWKRAEFQRLWNRPECKVVLYEENRVAKHLNIVSRFPQAFCGQGLTIEDLIVAGIRVLIQKTF